MPRYGWEKRRSKRELKSTPPERGRQEKPIRTVLLIELEPTPRPRRLRRLQSIYKRCLEEGLRALDLNRLELFRAKTEQLQNSRGDLRRLYRRRDIQAARRSGPCYHDGDISILGVVTPVLGDLALMTGIDDPVLSDANHVRYSGITLRDPDELRRRHARIDLPKTSRLNGLAVDARRGLGKRRNIPFLAIIIRSLLQCDRPCMAAVFP